MGGVESWGGGGQGAFFRGYGPFFKSENLAHPGRNRTTPESMNSMGYGPYLRGQKSDSARVPEM